MEIGIAKQVGIVYNDYNRYRKTWSRDKSGSVRKSGDPLFFISTFEVIRIPVRASLGGTRPVPESQN